MATASATGSSGGQSTITKPKESWQAPMRVAMRGRARSSGRASRSRPAAITEKPGGAIVRTGTARGAAAQPLRDPAHARQAQVALDRGLAQVGLEQQHPVRRGPGERRGEAERDRGLALAGAGAHDADGREARGREPRDLGGEEAELLRRGSGRCRSPPAASAARLRAAATALDEARRRSGRSSRPRAHPVSLPTAVASPADGRRPPSAHRRAASRFCSLGLTNGTTASTGRCSAAAASSASFSVGSR